MGRKFDPNSPTPDLHWKPTRKDDERLCRDVKRALAEHNLTLGNALRPLLKQLLRKLAPAPNP